MMYIKFKSDKKVNRIIILVTNVVPSIADTKYVQHRAQNATTVDNETILYYHNKRMPKCVINHCNHHALSFLWGATFAGLW